MRNKIISVMLILGLAVSLALLASAASMGTAWTYQGRLMDLNEPANGVHDFAFKLFDDPHSNMPIAEVNVPDVDVINGYFTAELDFGSSVFDGNACWLEIGVRPCDSKEPHTLLSPRQQVTPTPYALQTRGIFVDDSRNVGVGTTNPEEKLHVSGDIRLHAGGHIAFADGNTRIRESSDDLYLEARDDIRMDGDTLFVDGSENRVGIGTTVPDAPLEVKHSDWPDIVKIGMSGTLNRLILSSGATWASISGGTTNKDHIVIRHSTGNIGIGTTKPLSKLSVGGEGHLRTGVYGEGEDEGVYGYSSDGYGVRGVSTNNYGVYGSSGRSYAGFFNGSVYVAHDVSAASFTDRTPYPKDMDTAYKAIMSMERLPDGQYDENNREAQLDHSMLSDFVRSEDGNRDLSATVSCHNEVLKDLIRKQQELRKANIYIEQLQKQNELLEAKLAKLETMIAAKLPK